jgi:hypothetical protein
LDGFERIKMTDEKAPSVKGILQSLSEAVKKGSSSEPLEKTKKNSLVSTLLILAAILVTLFLTLAK